MLSCLQLLVNMNLLLYSIDLPVSYARNHTVRGLLCLASFSKQCVWVHPCYSMFQCLIPFYFWIVFHCMAVPHFIFAFVCWRTFALFPLFDIMKMLLWIVTYKVLCGHVFISLGNTLSSGLAGHMVTPFARRVVGLWFLDNARSCSLVSSSVVM